MDLVVYHHNDLDGYCSAAIIDKWAHRKESPFVSAPIRFIECDYRMDFDFLDITKDTTVAVVDFSFKPEAVARLRERAGRIIWCDHHITAKAYGYDNLEGCRDFEEKGMAGCECTWKFCFPDTPIPRAVYLLGDYDAWRLVLAPNCFRFYEYLKLEGLSPLSPIWQRAFRDPSVVEEGLKVGEKLIQYREAYCESILRKNGYETIIGGHKAYAINLYGFGSMAYGKKFKEYPICISYISNGSRYNVSLYSTAVDVSEIAKSFGGGGHKGAAGFTCTELPFKPVGVNHDLKETQ